MRHKVMWERPLRMKGSPQGPGGRTRVTRKNPLGTAIQKRLNHDISARIETGSPPSLKQTRFLTRRQIPGRFKAFSMFNL